jgi:hypothetical protein
VREDIAGGAVGKKRERGGTWLSSLPQMMCSPVLSTVKPVKFLALACLVVEREEREWSGRLGDKKIFSVYVP